MLWEERAAAASNHSIPPAQSMVCSTAGAEMLLVAIRRPSVHLFVCKTGETLRTRVGKSNARS